MKTTLFLKALHSHEDSSELAEFLCEHLGRVGDFIYEVIIHSALEVLKVIPFLFITYLLMEFIEHKAGDRTTRMMKRAGKLGPAIGGAAGALPQCGFSAMASNLYAVRVISLGTLLSVYLSTSDEMLPLLIGNSAMSIGKIALLLLYKVAVAVMLGFAVDLLLRLLGKGGGEVNIDEMCDSDGCHCEDGILRSSIHHTLSISLFVLIGSLLINSAVFFIGSERLLSLTYDKPVISHLVSALFGLIPSCAASVALTGFYTKGFITAGAMLSGLFSGAGIGLLVLFRVNKRLRDNLIIMALLVAFGFTFGLLFDLIAPAF